MLVSGLADLLHILDGLIELRAAGASFLDDVGDDDELASDLGVSGDSALGVLDHIVDRHVSGDRSETDLLADSLDLSGGMTIETGELNAVVAHVLDLLKGCLHVLLDLIADRVELQSNR